MSPAEPAAELYLASRSPRRSQLLGQLGLGFQVLDIAVPEQVAAHEPAEHYVQRVAADKARAGAEQAGIAGWVLAADTEVVLAGEVFGKPADAQAAHAMLQRLSGRTHAVLSAVHLLGPAGEEAQALCRSSVRFAVLDEPAIAAYIASGEPFDKAGAYAIQGQAAAFIAHLQGSYSGVMGLPLFETASLLRRYGLFP